MREIDNWKQQLVILIALFVGIIGVFAYFFGDNTPEEYAELEIIGYVNDRPLTRTAYDYHHEAANSSDDTRTPEKQTAIWNHLVNEELLIQQALRDQIIARDPNLRKYLAQAATGKIYQEARAAEISEETLRDFFDARKDLLTPSTYARVKRIYVRGAQADSQTRLKDIKQALTLGQNFDEVALSFGDTIPPKIPDRFMTFDELKATLGPVLAEAVIKLPTGSITNAIRAGSGWHFLFIADSKKAEAPSFVEVREVVEKLYREQTFDILLEQKLTQLKEEATIEFLP